MVLKLDLGGVGRNGDWTTVNTDVSGYRPSPDVVADITASADELGQHFRPGKADAIRCIHTLEHISAWDIMPTLRFWRSFLKPGGYLLIVVPDIGQMAVDYADGEIPFDVLAAVAYVSGFRTVQGPQEEHRWAWSDDTLIRDLASAGYVNARLAEDDHWPATWTLDFPDLVHTGCVGKYQVPNLRVIGERQ